MNRSAPYTVGAALSDVWRGQWLELCACENAVSVGDAEALHRFRVALRTTRALLRLFRAYLPAHRALSNELSWLSGSLNRARDLDVIMHFIENIAPSAVVVERRARSACLRELKRERLLQCENLRTLLQGKRYRRLSAAWERFIGRVAAVEKQGDPLSISIGTARRVVALRQSVKLLRCLRDIDESSDSAELHRIRIRCKRLRYLFEALPGDKKAIVSAANALKQLQTILGDHQDAVVIRAWLLQFSKAEDGRIAIPDPWMDIVERQYRNTLSALPRAWKSFIAVSKKI